MKKKTIRLNYKDKNIVLDLKNCNYLDKVVGLTFTRKKKAKALLFEFDKPVLRAIHSLFVFFDFVAIWISEEGKVIEVKIVKPWNFIVSPIERFTKLIEIPINKKYSDVVNLLVDSSSKIQKI